MPDLIAQGPLPQHRWRRRLPSDRKLLLGRAAGAWSVPWDDRVSRRHAEICWRHGRLEVERLPDTTNPIFVQGRQVDSFFLKPGQHFVIGGTTFSLSDERVSISIEAAQPVAEQSYSPQYLRGVRFRHADQRIEVLSRLPEIISGASSDNELFVRLVSLLLTGIPRATAAAVVAVDADAPEGRRINVLHWDRRALTGEDFCPSQRLILQAVRERKSVVYAWGPRSEPASPSFTVADDADWAFCTPLSGEACRGWAIYVSGRMGGSEYVGGPPSDPNDLRDDLKFTELAASTLGALREVRLLERNQASLSHFFSPIVLEALSAADPERVLAPREAEVSVLFCDLRGFSRQSEQASGDLMGLLQRVSRSLGVMTRHIRDQGGVVGDFHGDAAMGFWGWPLAGKDTIDRACLAALGIRTEFEAAARREGHVLANFRIGIGVASGTAVAGKIGTIDQVKVTVFGPVVNLASRLEGMTKYLRAAVLVDQTTAEAARRRLPRSVCRVRRLAVVRPFGMDSPVEVSELLPPEEEYPQLRDEHIAAYEEALDALLAGDWWQAFEMLHRVPASDRVKDFLTMFIVQHNRTPPPHWDGVIPLEAK